MMNIQITVNGSLHKLDILPMRRLLDILRENLKLTGTKEGCGEGECGACSVFFNGKLANSCLIPAHRCDGSSIVTIESLRNSSAGKLIAESFAEAHSSQCGFCTPGMAMATMNLLKYHPQPNEQIIREALSGNICRCTGYDMIVDGILLVALRATQEGINWNEV